MLTSTPIIDGFVDDIGRQLRHPESNEARTELMQIKFRVAAAVRKALITSNEASDLCRYADGFVTVTPEEGSYGVHEVHRRRDDDTDERPAAMADTATHAAAPAQSASWWRRMGRKVYLPV